jgi:HSP20 family protein
MASARTTQDTGRNSASTRDTVGNGGSARGRQASRGDQTQSDRDSALAQDQSRTQPQDQSRTQTQDQSRTQPQGQSGTQRGDMERQVPVGRETQRQGTAQGAGQSTGQSAGLTMRDQGQALGGAGTQQRINNNSPFSFMRRFGEEMDRLFEDFGFAPLGLDPMDLIIAAPRTSLAPNRALGTGTSGQRGLTTGRSALTRQSQAGTGTGAGAMTSSRAAWVPQVEVLQRGDNLVVRADLPGLRPEDVRVDVDNGALTISGERSYQTEDENEGLYHSERVYGSFIRTIPLPQGVNPEDVQARVADGVLEVTIPLPKESRSRRIDVR